MGLYTKKTSRKNKGLSSTNPCKERHGRSGHGAVAVEQVVDKAGFCVFVFVFRKEKTKM